MADRYLSKGWSGNEEFEEEDVWAVQKEREERSSLKVLKSSSSPLSASSSSAWRLPTAPKVIPTSGNNTSTNEASVPHQRLSAPVNVPDCAKYHLNKHNSNNIDALANGVNDLDLGGDNDNDDEMVPPHEYIARRLARSQIASFSMCEGVGRTLKGRDLSKLRNAILTKTGFLE